MPNCIYPYVHHNIMKEKHSNNLVLAKYIHLISVMQLRIHMGTTGFAVIKSDNRKQLSNH